MPAPPVLAGENPSVEESLKQQLRSLRDGITSDPEVLRLVDRANEANVRYTQKDIEKIDREWARVEGVDLFIVTLITNEIAEKLKMLQRKDPTLLEIFVTDKRGLVIAATNKTSDYLQADEAWWQRARDLKSVDGFWGDEEYDQSALAESVPLYMTIVNENQEFAGVLKAVRSKSEVPRRFL